MLKIKEIRKNWILKILNDFLSASNSVDSYIYFGPNRPLLTPNVALVRIYSLPFATIYLSTIQ